MGKTSKPISILCMDKELFQSESIKQFIDKGHHISISPSSDIEFESFLLTDYDVVIGPRCWRIDPRLKLGDDSTMEESLERQLEMMLEGVRLIKYPKEKA